MILFADKNYWLSGYKLVVPDDASSLPMFLADMMADIFTCGKSINLLRLISSQVTSLSQLLNYDLNHAHACIHAHTTHL